MQPISPAADPIRAVLFDAGNTLLRVRGSVGGVYAAVAREYGASVSGRELERHFHAVFGERRQTFLAGVSHPHSAERERAWWRGVVAEVFHRAGAEDALGGRFEAFFDRLYREFEKPEHWELFADVGPCLDLLGRHGVAAAVVSNWDSRLHAVLRGLGVAGAFRFVLTSAEFGAQKPHPAIFREAARRLGLPPEQVLHVGDALEDDVVGARQAGMHALWLRRDSNSGCPPDVPCVPDLRQVASRLAG